ncbi:SDR family NAD(P)-dependent oxidoreductase [Ferrovibrio sp.]|uniref:SDR family NAD(P)-dependent oxidoreductase n=1 Tax=Ferrovibrio sp. TaxID=1917215 RepID=UPI001BBDFBE6|nr:SDR family oxidoreductase [Alphaproteobacteria bacterium]
MNSAETTASQHFDLSRFPDLLKGDIAIVTGAAQGNGAAIAIGLAQCGAKIAVVDRDADKLAGTVDAIKANGGQAAAYHLDVADLAACQKLAGDVQRDLGYASVLVNNAGIVRRVGVEEDGFIASVHDQFTVNTLGSAHLVKAFLSQLTATKGRIINIGSIASFAATTGGIGYGASKGAVLMMTKTMAAELAPLGIRVNGVAPGLMITPMTAPTRNKPEAVRQYMDHIPMKRFGDAGELIGPILFLASQLSSYVTGVMLPVDGGYLIV